MSHPVRAARYVILDETSFERLMSLNAQSVKLVVDKGSADIEGNQHITLMPEDVELEPLTIAVAGVYSWKVPA